MDTDLVKDIGRVLLAEDGLALTPDLASKIVAAIGPAIQRGCDAAAAAELGAQADLLHRAAMMLRPLRAIAEESGESGVMIAIVDAQLASMQELATSLRRRAADLTPMDPALVALAALPLLPAGPAVVAEEMPCPCTCCVLGTCECDPGDDCCPPCVDHERE